jgi:hypothetical protein
MLITKKKGALLIHLTEDQRFINCITCLVRANITLIKTLVPPLRRASDRAI